MINSDAHVIHLASSVHADRAECLHHINGILSVDGLHEQDAAAEPLDSEQRVHGVVVWERLIIPHVLRCSMSALSTEALQQSEPRLRRGIAGDARDRRWSICAFIIGNGKPGFPLQILNTGCVPLKGTLHYIRPTRPRNVQSMLMLSYSPMRSQSLRIPSCMSMTTGLMVTSSMIFSQACRFVGISDVTSVIATKCFNYMRGARVYFLVYHLRDQKLHWDT